MQLLRVKTLCIGPERLGDAHSTRPNSSFAKVGQTNQPRHAAAARPFTFFSTALRF